MSNYPRVTIAGTFAVGADPYFIEGPIGGLGVPGLRTNDVIRGHQDGSVGANDYIDVRVIDVPVVIVGDDVDDCLANIAALVTAWQPVDTDVALAVKLSDTVTYSYTGRPGAAGQPPVDLDLDMLYKGNLARATLLFRVLDVSDLDT
jgi:hypothetical protein